MRKDPDRFYTTEDVATMLAVRPKTVRKWIEEGEVNAVKIRRQWRIAASELDRLLRGCSRAGR